MPSVVLWLAGLLACAAPLRAQETAPIPEPDITYLGSVPAGSEVAIEHAAGGLDADTATASEPYLLTVRLVQPVLAPPADVHHLAFWRRFHVRMSGLFGVASRPPHPV